MPVRRHPLIILVQLKWTMLPNKLITIREIWILLAQLDRVIQLCPTLCLGSPLKAVVLVVSITDCHLILEEKLHAIHMTSNVSLQKPEKMPWWGTNRRRKQDCKYQVSLLCSEDSVIVLLLLCTLTVNASSIIKAWEPNSVSIPESWSRCTKAGKGQICEDRRLWFGYSLKPFNFLCPGYVHIHL